jgi:hypothetical protein
MHNYKSSRYGSTDRPRIFNKRNTTCYKQIGMFMNLYESYPFFIVYIKNTCVAMRQLLKPIGLFFSKIEIANRMANIRLLKMLDYL